VAPVTEGDVERVATRLRGAERPVLLVGSQALLRAHAAEELAGAVVALGVPVYLAGSARGLLRGDHPLLLRHRRREALREADVVLLAGVPCDFRLEYGRQIHRDATVLAVNRSRRELFRNRRPAVGVVGDPGELLLRLAVGWPESPDRWTEWRERLGERDRERDAEIRRMAAEPTAFINPLTLCIAIERAAAEEATVVLDGGDFAATASYVVSARRPLGSLDPGPFGTLGVGAGFALAARLCRPDAEVWLLYGDGSAAFSLAEFDTFVRHQLPVIAIVGNDACWTQIARGQRDMLGDDVGTTLRHTDYHVVAEGYGGRGLKVDRAEDLDGVLAEAKRLAGSGVPVLVNALMGETSFRKGAIAI
jgi:acetolactate synthase-1/2/3 large subunit